MHFDFCIGNPPYQESRDTTKDMPVYNFFLDSAFVIADKSELIHPARFLFNAGATSKEWNRKLLANSHFKVLDYEVDSKKIFSNTDIKGGIAVTYYDRFKNFGPIGVFTSFSELSSLKHRMHLQTSLNTIMVPYSAYTLSTDLFVDYPFLKDKLSNYKIVTSNIFELLSFLFHDVKPTDGQSYCCLLGRYKNLRCYKYILSRYINVPMNYSNYKVILPAVNGSGSIGEVLSTPVIGTPLIGTPLIGYTQSFLGIGSFSTLFEAEACLKYIKTKFVRCLLGILKLTQHNPPEKWEYVPIQDFTDKSDIDWLKSVHEIDLQLYRKYGLSDEEIQFIEEKIKPME